MLTTITKLNPEALHIQLMRLERPQLVALSTAIKAALEKKDFITAVLETMTACGVTLADLGCEPITEPVDGLAEFASQATVKPKTIRRVKLKSIQSKVDMGETLVKLTSGGMKAGQAEAQQNVASSTAHNCKALYKAVSKFQNKINKNKSMFDYGNFNTIDLLKILAKVNLETAEKCTVTVNTDWTVYKAGTHRVLVIGNGKVLFLTHEAYNGYVSNGHR